MKCGAGTGVSLSVRRTRFPALLPDRPSGLPVLATMIAEGIPVLSRSPALLEDARRIAAETLRSGPPLLSPETLRNRRGVAPRPICRGSRIVS